MKAPDKIDKKNRVLRIRFKDGPKFGTKLVLSSNHRGAARRFAGGRVLKVNKVGFEELFKVGEFSPVNGLLEELREEAKQLLHRGRLENIKQEVG